ncbi:ECF transporter S component [Lactococcus garvieae]|uniref:ECF transporter S component n=1 Tax=Lactococcus garvieae TaxID=1363 RepID=UPI0022E44C62|nr:ECF transporter S component [Lactococcus garvieae]
MSNSKTRRLTLIAMLSAISFVLSYPMFQFPLVPSASFLKIDFTILPILIGLFMLGLSSAFAILIIRSLLWLLLNSDGVNTYIGLPMNIIAVTVFVLVLWFFLRHRFSLRNYIMATILGTLALTAVQVVLNYVYAIPLYSMFAHFDIATMFPGGISAYIGVVVVFNILQGLIFAGSFALLYWALRGSKSIKFINA